MALSKKLSCETFQNYQISMYNSNTDSLGLILDVNRSFFSLGHCSGALLRILCIVTFFIPYLGLFDILNHWRAEQIPLWIRSNKYALLASNIKLDDKIELRRLMNTVLWGELARWNYSDPAVPIPPPYTLYTYFTLKESFQAFLILMATHALVILFVKIVP